MEGKTKSSTAWIEQMSELAMAHPLTVPRAGQAPPAGAPTTSLRRYAAALKLRQVGDSGEGNVDSYCALLSTITNKSCEDLKFSVLRKFAPASSNILEHWRKHHSYMLYDVDRKSTDEEIAAAKKEEAIERAEHTFEQRRESAMFFLVLAGMSSLPEYLAGTTGWRVFSMLQGIAPINRSLVQRMFTKKYDELVVAPRKKFVDVVKQIVEVNIGGVVMRFKTLLTLISDGWKLMRGKHRYESLVLSGAHIVPVVKFNGVIPVHCPGELVPYAMPIALALAGKRAAGEPAAAAAASAAAGGVSSHSFTVDDNTSLGLYTMATDKLREVEVSEDWLFASMTDGAANARGMAGFATEGGPRMMYERVEAGKLASFSQREGLISLVCLEHGDNLGVSDVLKHEDAKSAIEPAKALASFLSSSTHHSALVEQAQLKMGVTKPLVLPTSCPTRFKIDVLVSARMERLRPALTSLSPDAFDDSARKSNGKPVLSHRAEFTKAYSSFSASEPAARILAELLGPSMCLSARLGAKKDYTASLRLPYLQFLLKSADGLLQKSPELVSEYKSCIFRRFAPLSWYSLERFEDLGVSPPKKSSVEYDQLIRLDEVSFAALALDPALFHLRDEYGVDASLTKAFLARTLFGALELDGVDGKDKEDDSGDEDEGEDDGEDSSSSSDVDGGGGGGGSSSDDAGGGGSAAAAGAGAGAASGVGSKRKRKPKKNSAAAKRAAATDAAAIKVNSKFETYAAEKTHINTATVRGFAESAAAFEARKKALLKGAQQRWRIGPYAKGAAAAVKVVNKPDQIALDLITEGVEKEWGVLDDILGGVADIEATFGHVFAPATFGGVEYKRNSKRYSFWAENKERMPLLYICAHIILCSPATSMRNESFHSIATFILRANRRGLTPMKAEAYCLMHELLPVMLAEKYPAFKLIEREAEKTGFLNVADIEHLLNTKFPKSCGGSGDDDDDDDDDDDSDDKEEEQVFDLTNTN